MSTNPESLGSTDTDATQSCVASPFTVTSTLSVVQSHTCGSVDRQLYLGVTVTSHSSEPSGQEPDSETLSGVPSVVASPSVAVAPDGAETVHSLNSNSDAWNGVPALSVATWTADAPGTRVDWLTTAEDA